MQFKLVTEGDALLNKKLEPFDFESNVDAELIANQMVYLMLAHEGIGVAANQVGFDRRVIAVQLKNHDPMVMFNPEIIDHSGTYTDQEGCLSFPDLFIKVERFQNVTVKYVDKTNNTCTIALSGIDSKCVQHEIDHLDGICFVSRVSRLKLDLARKRQRKLSNGRTK